MRVWSRLAMVVFVFAGCSSETSVDDTGAGEIDARAKEAGGKDSSSSDAGADQSVIDLAATDQSPADTTTVPNDLVVGDTSAGCLKLMADFAALLAKIKECNPFTEMNECTTKIPNSLDCPCDTYVNSGNAAEVKQLYDLDQQWKQDGCVSPGCPPTPCAQPTGAACEQQGTAPSGVCEDIL